jgi:hypothetical protein
MTLVDFLIVYSILSITAAIVVTFFGYLKNLKQEKGERKYNDQ